jgi:hypothetical protein
VSRRINEEQRVVSDVGIRIRVAAGESDGVFADKPLEAGVVVARPTVTPDARLAEKSAPPPMRVATMRPSVAEAGGAGAVEAPTSEVLKNGVFGGYPGSLPAIGCDPGGAPALRRRPRSADGVDGAVATMATIVATSGPPLQVHGTRRGSGRWRGDLLFSG